MNHRMGGKAVDRREENPAAPSLCLAGAFPYYGVPCAFYSRVGWAQASRAAWSMTCDALFFASLIGVNLVAAAGRLALWLWRLVRRLFPPLQVIIH